MSKPAKQIEENWTKAIWLVKEQLWATRLYLSHWDIFDFRPVVELLWWVVMTGWLFVAWTWLTSGRGESGSIIHATSHLFTQDLFCNWWQALQSQVVSRSFHSGSTWPIFVFKWCLLRWYCGRSKPPSLVLLLTPPLLRLFPPLKNICSLRWSSPKQTFQFL
jgi:hypothetical protein